MSRKIKILLVLANGRQAYLAMHPDINGKPAPLAKPAVFVNDPNKAWDLGSKDGGSGGCWPENYNPSEWLSALLKSHYGLTNCQLIEVDSDSTMQTQDHSTG